MCSTALVRRLARPLAMPFRQQVDEQRHQQRGVHEHHRYDVPAQAHTSVSRRAAIHPQLHLVSWQQGGACATAAPARHAGRACGRALRVSQHLGPNARERPVRPLLVCAPTRSLSDRCAALGVQQRLALLGRLHGRTPRLALVQATQRGCFRPASYDWGQQLAVHKEPHAHLGSLRTCAVLETFRRRWLASSKPLLLSAQSADQLQYRFDVHCTVTPQCSGAGNLEMETRF